MESVTKKPNVPALRFPEFSGEWEETELGNVFSFYPTNSLSRNKLSELGEGPFVVHYGDIHTKLGAKIRDYRVLPQAIEQVKGEPCTAGDLLVADASEDYADIGKATEVTTRESATILGGLHVIHMRPAQGVFAVGFLSALFQSARIRTQIRRRANGATVLGLSASQIRQIKGRWPELAEQEKVAAFLTVVDERFGLLKRKKELLEEYKKGVMQRLFSREIRFKDEDGNEYPEWEVKRLGEVVEQRTESGEFEAIMLSVTINNGIKRFSDLGKKDNSNPDKSKYQLVKTGDIVYNTLRLWQGASGISHEKGFVSPAYTVLTAKDGNLNEFIAFWMKLPSSIFMFQRNSQGLTSDQWTCKFKSLSTIKTPFPKTGEQKRIVAFLNGIESRVELLDKQIWNLAMFKKALMQNMFV